MEEQTNKAAILADLDPLERIQERLMGSGLSLGKAHGVRSFIVAFWPRISR